MGEPYGRFGTHLGMPEEDFLKICTDCKKTEYDMLSYKEIRIVSDIKASVVYFFSNIGKANVLLQIVITPLVKYDIGNDLSKIYLIFQNYINNNIARMSDVKKIQDTNGNFIGYESYANFKYSSIFHTFTFNDGKIIHTISFYKTKQKD